MACHHEEDGKIEYWHGVPKAREMRHTSPYMHKEEVWHISRAFEFQSLIVFLSRSCMLCGERVPIFTLESVLVRFPLSISRRFCCFVALNWVFWQATQKFPKKVRHFLLATQNNWQSTFASTRWQKNSLVSVSSASMTEGTSGYERQNILQSQDTSLSFANPVVVFWYFFFSAF